jgi:hypothetical protein
VREISSTLYGEKMSKFLKLSGGIQRSFDEEDDLNSDGTIPMTGDLNFNGHKATNLAEISNDVGTLVSIDYPGLDFSPTDVWEWTSGSGFLAIWWNGGQYNSPGPNYIPELTPITFTIVTGTSLPTGLAEATTYYKIGPTDDNGDIINVSTTADGLSRVPFVDAGDATFTVNYYGAPFTTGTIATSANLNMLTNKITNLANGTTASQDAATVAQVETLIGAIDTTAFIQHNGSVDFSADQSMGSHKLTNLGNGTAASQDAATVAQVETLIGAIDTTAFIQHNGSVDFSADQSMGTHKLTNLTDGTTASQDAATVAQVETLIGAIDTTAFIQHNGSVAFSADQSMGTFKLTNLSDGTAASQDAATVAQVETLIGEVLPAQTIPGQVLQTNGSVASWFSLVPPNSMVWTDSTGVAPTTAVDGILLGAFDNVSNSAIYSTVTIPSLYPAGSAIKLKYGQFFNASVTGKVFFKAVTKLIKSGTVLGTYPDTFTSSNGEVTVNATSNTITNTGDIDLCSTTGTINDVNIVSGMKLLIQLIRDNASESSPAADDALLIVNSFEMGFEAPSAAAVLTGGTITTSGLYTYHTFLSSANLVVSGGSRNIDYLMVGAGGSGGGYDGSGGGGGGFIETFSSSISSNTYPIVIGAGALSSNGGNTTFNSITAIGGGHGGPGGGYSSTPFYPTSGGSGGGGASAVSYEIGGAGTVGQGYAGGNALAPGGSYPSAGGGGAGGVGESIITNTDDGGDGGVGALSTITGNYYAGGGGGGSGNGGGGSIPGIGVDGGGSGGLVSAVDGSNIYSGTVGTANTGGGGGGGGNIDGDFHSGYVQGGSGIVVIRYLT